MKRRFDVERDMEQFQEWSQSLPDALFAEYANDWMHTLKPDSVIRRDGLTTFEDWLYENRWPAYVPGQRNAA